MKYFNIKSIKNHLSQINMVCFKKLVSTLKECCKYSVSKYQFKKKIGVIMFLMSSFVCFLKRFLVWLANCLGRNGIYFIFYNKLNYRWIKVLRWKLEIKKFERILRKIFIWFEILQDRKNHNCWRYMRK